MRALDLKSLDPRAKILGLGAFLLPFLLPLSLALRLASLACLLALWILGRLPARTLGLGLGAVAVLLGTTLAFYGLARGLYVDLGILGTTLALLLLVSATPPLELAEGLELLFAPLARLGLPVHEGVMIFHLSLRFVPMVGREASSLLQAAKSRGAFSGRSLRDRLADLLSLVLPLLVLSLVRASELAAAMDSRCYQGGKGRTGVRTYAFRGRDRLFLALGLAFLLAVGVDLFRLAGA